MLNTVSMLVFANSKIYYNSAKDIWAPNRRYKLILEIDLSKGFAPTCLIISIFHRLIGQYFESGILFISQANLHGGKR